jgi:hypothetical protein
LFCFFNLFIHVCIQCLSHRTMLNRSGDSGHPCLILDFRENGFSFSPLNMMLAVGLSYIAFTMLRHILSLCSEFS